MGRNNPSTPRGHTIALGFSRGLPPETAAQGPVVLPPDKELGDADVLADLVGEPGRALHANALVEIR